MARGVPDKQVGTAWREGGGRGRSRSCIEDPDGGEQPTSRPLLRPGQGARADACVGPPPSSSRPPICAHTDTCTRVVTPDGPMSWPLLRSIRGCQPLTRLEGSGMAWVAEFSGSFPGPWTAKLQAETELTTEFVDLRQLLAARGA